MLIVDAASHSSALFVILIGALGVLPIILGYTIYAYWIFRGKAQADGYRMPQTQGNHGAQRTGHFKAGT